jgi:DNA-binding XRE family transcriptional regulator
MNRVKKPNTALKKIREATELNQTDFAKAVGTTSLIAAIESGSRSLKGEEKDQKSGELKGGQSDLVTSIMAFTGCDPVALMEGRAVDIAGRPYTSDIFNEWRTTGGNPEVVEAAADRAADLVRALIVASSSDAEGERTPQKFRRTLFSLSESLGKLIRDVDLIDRTNIVLMEQAPNSDEWKTMSLGKAREMFGRERGWPAADFKEFGDMQMIEVKVSTAPAWSPLGGSVRLGNSRKTFFAEHYGSQRTKVEIRTRSLKGKRVRVFSFLKGVMYGVVGSAIPSTRAIAKAQNKAKKTGR